MSLAQLMRIEPRASRAQVTFALTNDLSHSDYHSLAMRVYVRPRPLLSARQIESRNARACGRPKRKARMEGR